MKKAMQITTAILFSLFLAGFGLMHLILPDRTFSPTENRNLSSFPEFSWSALVDGGLPRTWRNISRISSRCVTTGWD